LKKKILDGAPSSISVSDGELKYLIIT
jgi:hypothetical protein